jgi:hypothetical protein
MVGGPGPGGWTGADALVKEGPDLRIANVFARTPGGLCAGAANTLQVMIRNESRVPVAADFVVRLRIRRPTAPPSVQERDQTVTGIDSLEVKSVLFRNVDLIEGLHAVTATVDATGRIAERPGEAEANNGFPGPGQIGPTPNVTRSCPLVRRGQAGRSPSITARFNGASEPPPQPFSPGPKPRRSDR